MRVQRDKVQTGVTQKCLLIAVAILLTAGLVYAAVNYFDKAQPAYIPPEFDATAQSGVPTPAQNLAYGEIDTENGVKFSLAGTMYQQIDGSLLIYLTNPESSRCIISCEIKNEAGETLYKSGAIRHGEYVERLMPLTDIENVATPIILKVYAFEPGTWYSMGEVQLSNILQPY